MSTRIDPKLVCQSPLPIRDHSGGFIMVSSNYRTPSRPNHFGGDFGSTDGIEVGVDLYPLEPSEVIRLGTDPGVGAGRNLWLYGLRTGLGWKMFHTMSGLWLVEVGDEVDYDDQVADVGNTGTGAAHLHLQCHDLRNRDPRDWRNWGDHTTIDPVPIVRAAWDAGRWPGMWSGFPTELPPTQPKEEELTVGDIQALKEQLDRIEQKQAQFEADTRVWVDILGDQETAKQLNALAQLSGLVQLHLDPNANGVDEVLPLRSLVEQLKNELAALTAKVNALTAG